MVLTFPVTTSHSFIVPFGVPLRFAPNRSLPPDANVFPSGLKATHRTATVCAFFQVAVFLPLATSQSLIALSVPPGCQSVAIAAEHDGTHRVVAVSTENRRGIARGKFPKSDPAIVPARGQQFTVKIESNGPNAVGCLVPQRCIFARVQIPKSYRLACVSFGNCFAVWAKCERKNRRRVAVKSLGDFARRDVP